MSYCPLILIYYMIVSRNYPHLKFYLVVMSLYNIVEASVLTLTTRTVLIDVILNVMGLLYDMLGS